MSAAIMCYWRIRIAWIRRNPQRCAAAVEWWNGSMATRMNDLATAITW